MDNVHGAHGATGVVEDPFLVVVDEVLGRDLGSELVHNVRDNGACVVVVRFDGALRHVLKVAELEDVELFEVLLEHVGDRIEDANEDRKQLEPADDATAAATG